MSSACLSEPRLSLSLRVGPARLRPIDHIAGIGSPVLLINGTRDEHTSIREAESLLQAARPPRYFWAVEGAAHVNLHQFAPRDYERHVALFLDQYLIAPEN